MNTGITMNTKKTLVSFSYVGNCKKDEKIYTGQSSIIVDSHCEFFSDQTWQKFNDLIESRAMEKLGFDNISCDILSFQVMNWVYY